MSSYNVIEARVRAAMRRWLRAHEDEGKTVSESMAEAKGYALACRYVSVGQTEADLARLLDLARSQPDLLLATSTVAGPQSAAEVLIGVVRERLWAAARREWRDQAVRAWCVEGQHWCEAVVVYTSEEDEVGVLLDGRGRATNNYADGTAGVPGWLQQDAESLADSAACVDPDCNGVEVEWRLPEAAK